MKNFLIFSSLFFLSGCSLIGGQSFSHLMIGLLAAAFLAGCNESFSIRPGNIQVNEPPTEPSEPDIDLSDFVELGDFYIPNVELEELGATPTYKTNEINYFKLEKQGTASAIDATHVNSQDFLVITADYRNHFFIPSNISLGDGDDTLVLEGYHDFSTSEVNLGAGDDHLVLGNGYFYDYMGSVGKLILGSGSNKVYISPIENYSVIKMNLPEDKIVLTGGLTYSDLHFRLGAEGVNISIKDPRATASEDVEIILLTISATWDLANVSDPINFEVSKIVDARRGLYRQSGSKFPTTSKNFNEATYLLQLAPLEDLYSHEFEFTDYMGTSYFFDYMGFNEGASGITIPFDQVIGHDSGAHYFSHSEGFPLYFMSTAKVLPYSYARLSKVPANRTIHLGQSFWPSSPGDLVISKNISTLDASITLGFNPGRVFSHPEDTSSLNIYNNSKVDLNGKRSGVISASWSQLDVIVGRMGSEAILQLSGNSAFTIELADNIIFTDLIFEEDTSRGLVYVRVIDDAGHPVTLFKYRGVSLSEARNPSHYITHAPPVAPDA